MKGGMQQEIFTRNLNRLLSERNLMQLEVAKSIGVSAQTFNTWCRGVALPRMDKIQRLADYFRINKSELIDEHYASNEDTSITDEEQALLELFRSLNAIGKRKAIESLEDLTQIEKYTRAAESISNAV